MEQPDETPPPPPAPAVALSPEKPRLILASTSPQRKKLLADAGFEFLIEPSNVDERAQQRPGIMPADLALRLAVAKAEAVAEKYPHDVVLGADTVVAFGDLCLGQPPDAVAARVMLRLLESTTHLVMTGVAVVHQAAGHRTTARVTSAVRMRPLTQDQIEAYVLTDIWRGKAGGYGIQENDPFVDRVSGCHTNIIGLPMTTTKRLLHEAGIDPRENSASS